MIGSTGASGDRSVAVSTALRRRLILTIAPVLIVIAGVMSLAVARITRRIAIDIISESSVASIQALTLVLEGRPPAEAREILESFVVEPSLSGFVLADGSGRLERLGTVDGSALLAEGRDLTSDRPVGAAVRGFGPVRSRLVTAARLEDGRLLVYERRAHGLWTPFTLAAVAVSASVLLVGMVTAWLLAQRLYRPVVARLALLEQALSSYGTGDTSVRLDAGRSPKRDEFDQVSTAFNSMADRIAALEEERRQRDKAEQALLAELAHDINTPITVLRGFAETLVERGDRLGERERNDISSELLGQSVYVQAIVEDLLTLASARTATLRVRKEPVTLDELYDTVVDSFSPVAEQRGIALIADAGGAVAWADPVRLRQVLNNLVRNSILHATRATLIEIGAAPSGGGVVLWVEDDGGGVPTNLVPRLFERGRSGSGRGWGLGLAIVRTLAELHGGRARYCPVEGGARFEVWLPPTPDEGAVT